MKLDVAVPPTEARCQHWKFQVSPAAIAAKPAPVGVMALSIVSWTSPSAPEFASCEGAT